MTQVKDTADWLLRTVAHGEPILKLDAIGVAFDESMLDEMPDSLRDCLMRGRRGHWFSDHRWRNAWPFMIDVYSNTFSAGNSAIQWREGLIKLWKHVATCGSSSLRFGVPPDDLSMLDIAIAKGEDRNADWLLNYPYVNIWANQAPIEKVYTKPAPRVKVDVGAHPADWAVFQEEREDPYRPHELINQVVHGDGLPRTVNRPGWTGPHLPGESLERPTVNTGALYAEVDLCWPDAT